MADNFSRKKDVAPLERLFTISLTLFVHQTTLNHEIALIPTYKRSATKKKAVFGLLMSSLEVNTLIHQLKYIWLSLAAITGLALTRRKHAIKGQAGNQASPEENKA